MFRISTAVIVVLLLASAAHAAGRRRYYTATPMVSTSTHAYSSGSTATAQGVAELQASNCRMGHYGGNSGYEGVGMGSSPEDALGRCCYSNSGMRVIDQGVARGRDGRWYACKRYR
jgi:hypothetical protein